MLLKRLAKCLNWSIVTRAHAPHDKVFLLPHLASAVRALPGRLSALSVLRSKVGLHGAFVWARRALNNQKWRFPARAG
jgi:hypothetical protein